MVTFIKELTLPQRAYNANDWTITNPAVGHYIATSEYFACQLKLDRDGVESNQNVGAQQPTNASAGQGLNVRFVQNDADGLYAIRVQLGLLYASPHDEMYLATPNVLTERLRFAIVRTGQLTQNYAFEQHHSDITRTVATLHEGQTWEASLNLSANSGYLEASMAFLMAYARGI